MEEKYTDLEFHDRLKKLRTDLGYSVEELAQNIGVSKTTVHRWEKGDIKNLRQDNIGKLAQTLHTSPSDLMGWDEETDPAAEEPILLDSPFTPDEQEFIELYRRASPTDREIVDLILFKGKKPDHEQ